MIERNPVAAYSVVVWAAALALTSRELAQHPSALAVTAGVLMALLGGRTVSLAEERREARRWRLPKAATR